MNLIAPPPPAKPLYSALGVRETATADEIREAYMRIALRHHPDVSENDEVFMRAKDAYELLRDPELRREYDRTGVDPRAAFQGIGREAMTRLVNATIVVIGIHGPDASVVALIRIMLNEEIQAARAQISKIAAAQKRARLAAGNIAKRWSGATAVRERIIETIRTQVCEDETQQAQQEHVIEVATAALRLLADAHYDDVAMEREFGNLWSPATWIVTQG